MEGTTFILVASLVIAYGLVSRRLESTVVTAPMVFVAAGLVLAPQALDVLHLDADHGAVHLIAELTLVLVLFADAARIDLGALKSELGLPVRLLTAGMPLTIVLGAALAWLLIPGLTPWEAGVLGAILAPTDAALGQAVVSHPGVPRRIRQALNVESGLNDGIALPVVLLLASICSMGVAEARTAREWLQFGVLQVTVGPAFGIAGGWLGARLVRRADSHGWMSGSFERLSGLALALLAFAGAEALHGNGFIAAFTAGLVVGETLRGRCEWLHDFLEAEGQLLMLLVFLMLGSGLAWPALSQLSAGVAIYAAASLTIVRMLPVALAMLGTGLRPASVVFLGWFGPRGLASILFGILVLERAELANEHLIFSVVICTVLVSIFAHGVSAVPASNAYARLTERRRESCEAEHREVSHHPLRARARGVRSS